MVIAGWADTRGIAVRFPQGRIARRSKVSDRYVRRAIDWLMDHGELVVEIGMGGSEDVAWNKRPNRYTVLMHPGKCNTAGPDKSCTKPAGRVSGSTRKTRTGRVSGSSQKSDSGGTPEHVRVETRGHFGGACGVLHPKGL